MTEYGIAQDSLVTSAAQVLRKMLLSGEIGMGERVREERIAGRLGISRPPVREAMRLVHGEGLLEHVPRKGYRVTMLTDGAVHEILELRELLESHALRIVSSRTEPLQLQAVETVIEQMKASSEEEDVVQVVSLATDFHLQVVRLADNFRLIEYYRELMLQTQLWLANKAKNDHSESSGVTLLAQHQELLDILKQGDWARIRAAFSEHSSYESLRRSAVTASNMLV